MEMKFAFVIVLVVASVMSTEATRFLPEEAHEIVLHGGESLPHGDSWLYDVKEVRGTNCENGCRKLCVDPLTPFVITCCICN
ncbi:hypothetical protein Bca4012_085994 [Brassica carinata]